MKLENEIDKEVTEELKKVSKIQNLEKENQELQKMTKKIYEENEDLKAKLRSKIK
jgi:soluble cytochrome b562